MQNEEAIYSLKLSDNIFDKFSRLIYEQSGIHLLPEKKVMLEGRLRKRLKVMQLDSFEEYYQLFSTQDGLKEELRFLLNAVTTNKTDFFREPAHFEYLKENLLPQHMAKVRSGYKTTFSVWSAGCSSGEEPYTLAMLFSEYKEQFNNFYYEIFASDIDTEMLQNAIKAVYPLETIEDIAIDFKTKYFLKSKDSFAKLVRLVPEIRESVEFFKLNLMDKVYNNHKKYDLIFCRNVIIYFDRKTQEEVINKFAQHLTPGGYLFLGHSETINGLVTPFKRIASTIYQLKQKV